jgi:NADH-quinone oxidoreductase subunit C
MITEDLIQKIKDELGDLILSHDVSHGELSIFLPRERLLDAMEKLCRSQELGFSMLIDICGADYPARQPRFEVVYHLLSMKNTARVRLKVQVDTQDRVPSLLSLFPNAGWYEREVWDLFGIGFEGNPDLRRILTDYGFEGHPLRKDFPLTGFVELRYDEEQKRVVYEPVKLQQDYRVFDSLSPWEGMTQVQLAGDEKAVQPKHGWKATGS